MFKLQKKDNSNVARKLCLGFLYVGISFIKKKKNYFYVTYILLLFFKRMILCIFRSLDFPLFCMYIQTIQI